jgi:hypothetical protein
MVLAASGGTVTLQQRGRRETTWTILMPNRSQQHTWMPPLKRLPPPVMQYSPTVLPTLDRKYCYFDAY